GSPYPPGSSARLERRGAGTFGGGRRHLRYKRSGSGFNLTFERYKGSIAKCSTPATIGTVTATYHLPPAKGVVIIGPRTLYERGLSGIRTLIEVQPPVERAFLVGAPRKGTAEATQVEEHLDELGRLADTAGADIVGRTYQRIEAPTPNFYLGQGKVEELKGVLNRNGSTLVLFDEPLSPVQGTNLEQVLAVRVMDRTEVILDIFATRARSAEAKLQVELAQLEYLLPRLTRMWTHLSRIRGGIGLRGPGETQLETDRRVIRQKISTLKRRLEEVADHRANVRQGRRLVPSAALVGYTNAGKSSLVEALSGDDAQRGTRQPQQGSRRAQARDLCVQQGRSAAGPGGISRASARALSARGPHRDGGAWQRRRRVAGGAADVGAGAPSHRADPRA